MTADNDYMPENIIIKNPEQINGIRKSCRLASAALDYILPFVVEGITTSELDDRIATFIDNNGAIAAPKGYKVGDKIYPKSTCISLNEVVCHGIPDDYILKSGDILNIDVTTILDGYYGDTSRMFSIGKVSQKAERLIHDTKRAMMAGIEAVVPNKRFGVIGNAITNYAMARKYGIVDVFCGHGVGIEFHEPPMVCHYSSYDMGEIMKPGMIFTIEPMLNTGTHRVIIKSDGWTAVTADKSLSAQWEHTILVTDDGYEILTAE